MTSQVKILAFAGATRKVSFNKKLVAVAATGAKAAGADVTVVDLADYAMPLYDGDVEAASGLPEKAIAFKKLLSESDGFLIASPEYNSSFSAVLKNAIDWTSRPEHAEDKPLSAYRGKYAAIMATSPGGLGGLRGLYPLRELLQNISVTVLPSMQAVGQSMSAFDAQDQLKDAKTRKAVEALGAELVTVLGKVKA